jgi:hypothetical protein
MAAIRDCLARGVLFPPGRPEPKRRQGFRAPYSRRCGVDGEPVVVHAPEHGGQEFDVVVAGEGEWSVPLMPRQTVTVALHADENVTAPRSMLRSRITMIRRRLLTCLAAILVVDRRNGRRAFHHPVPAHTPGP